MTRDILTRGILSDSAMELLFEAHVERNRHQLREVDLTKKYLLAAYPGFMAFWYHMNRVSEILYTVKFLWWII